MDMISQDTYDSTTEDLNRVWKRFVSDSNKSSYFTRANYNTVSRKTLLAVRFEDWLWEHGIRVIQQNHKRFMRFYSRDDAVMFMLKHG